MIIGIGTDIIEIHRIEQAVTRNERFLSKIFTEKELAYFDSKNSAYTSIAGNFAAKEAITKVLGTGLRGFRWTDMEISRDDLGKPSVTLYGEAKKLADSLDITEIMVSISHCTTYAVAYCVGVNQHHKGDV